MGRYYVGDGSYGSITGTNGNNYEVQTLSHTNGNCWFFPIQGMTVPNRDTVYLYDGNDTVFSGGNYDTLYGGNGDDLLSSDRTTGFVQTDAAQLVGADSCNDYYSRAGKDLIYGEAGNDALYGLDENDTLHGGDDNDYLSAGVYSDGLYADDGNDTLVGGDHYDTLEGGTGSDYLNPQGGTNTASGIVDQAYGGAGADIIAATAYKGQFITMVGGADPDFFIISGATAQTLSVPTSGEPFGDFAYNVILPNAVKETQLIVKTLFATSLKALPVTSFVIDSFGPVFSLFKGIFDKYVYGPDSTNQNVPAQLDSNVSALVQDFNPTEDTVMFYFGENGNLKFTEAPTNYTSHQGTSVTGLDIENLNGESVAFIGSDGFTNEDFGLQLFQQVINSRVTVFNDDGNTPTMLIGNNPSDSDIDSYNQDTVTDEVGIFEELAGLSSSFILFGAYGAKELYGPSSNSGSFLFGTQEYGDTLSGPSRDAQLRRNNRSDAIYGYGGDDYLTGGGASDFIFAGAGIDTASYSLADGGILVVLTDNSAYNASAGTYIEAQTLNTDNLTFTTTNLAVSQSPALTQFGLANSLTATSTYGVVKDAYRNSNNDIVNAVDTLYDVENVVGSIYADELYGNSQDNTFYGLDGNDTIDGGNGNDTVDYSYAETAVTINNGSHLTSGYTITVSGTDTDTIANIENFIGSDQNDSLIGSSAANIIEGGAGNDTLGGGPGNDTLDGGLGTNLHQGGGDFDRFVISNDGRYDIISDFATDQDYILLSGGLTYNNLSFANANDGLGSINILVDGTVIATGLGDEPGFNGFPESRFQTESETVSGTVSSGPMRQTQVYFDGNGNNQLDIEEPSGFTDENGDFSLEIPHIRFDKDNDGFITPEDGNLIALGGTDTISQTPSQTIFSASLNHDIVTPLTTLLVTLEERGLEAGEAETIIKSVLGIDQAVDLTTFNAVEILQTSPQDPVAESVYAGHIIVTALLNSITHLLGGVKVNGPEGHDTLLELIDHSNEEAEQVIANVFESLAGQNLTITDLTAVELAFANALGVELDQFTQEQVGTEKLNFLASGITQKLSIIEQIFTTVEAEGQLLLDASANFKTVVNHTIARILHEVGADTLTMEKAEDFLNQLSQSGLENQHTTARDHTLLYSTPALAEGITTFLTIATNNNPGDLESEVISLLEDTFSSMASENLHVHDFGLFEETLAEVLANSSLFGAIEATQINSVVDILSHFHRFIHGYAAINFYDDPNLGTVTSLSVLEAEIGSIATAVFPALMEKVANGDLVGIDLKHELVKLFNLALDDRATVNQDGSIILTISDNEIPQDPNSASFPEESVLEGTIVDDLITGGRNSDLISTGEGNDRVIYRDFGDRTDTITDFEIGADLIDVSQLLDSLGYEGSNPIADGYLSFQEVETIGTGFNAVEGTIISLDVDGSAGPLSGYSLASLAMVSEAALNNADNFIF